ncbi:MAG: ribonuclease HIII [Candidatus Aminicenantes bacterium]|nr:ribonuclease HIII [Candidatus Aminicenantes bacterium]
MEQERLFPPAKGHIGTDESGKGDYFGPLIIAGFFLPEDQADVLRELGVKDSKRTSDNRCLEIAEVLKAGYKHAVIAIGPEKYNELYDKLRNLNRLLAWGHARAIENILEVVDCVQAVTDQFGDKAWVLNALMKKGRTIELVQNPRAEEDMAVAAASILARAEFLKRLSFLSKDNGLELPKGASSMVEDAAVKLVERDGPEVLGKVAKLHFKTTGRVLDRAGAKLPKG